MSRLLNVSGEECAKVMIIFRKEQHFVFAYLLTPFLSGTVQHRAHVNDIIKKGS